VGAHLLDSVLSRDLRSTHRISLLLAGEQVGVASPGPASFLGLQSRNDWSLLGQQWSVQVAPTAAWVSQQQSSLPLGALFGGLFFSGLLAWTVLKMAEARLTVVALRQSDDALRREAAERKVAEQERDQFFTLSIDMLCISNADGYFKRLNPAFERTLGYTLQELTTRPFLDFVHPDDIAATLAEVDRQVLEGSPTMHFENRYRRKDGTYRWLAWKSTPDVTSGMMFALARDVTNERLTAQRLEASEEHYRGLVEAATDIIYRTDPAGRFEFVNAVAVRVTGFSQEELLGMHFTELVRPDQREAVRDWYEAQWGRVLTLTRHEFPVVARDGREIWIEQTVQPVAQNGRIVAFQAIARDVTDRKSMEAERERLISELQSNITQVRTLSEMLPMCSSCRRIRDDEDGSWHQLEKYLSKTKSGTQVSHGICPECTRELYPDYMRRKDARDRAAKA
jgi:PAS domain S-box-containing protein